MSMVLARARSFPARRRFLPTRPRRPVEWKRGLMALPVSVSPGSNHGQILVTQQVLSDQYTRPTIVRVHLDVNLYATGEDASFVIGTLGVTLARIGEGIPCPSATGNSNRWMLWRGFYLSTVAAGYVDQVNYRNYVFDIRSMRKPADDEELLLIIDTLAGSTAAVNMWNASSVLVKE